MSASSRCWARSQHAGVQRRLLGDAANPDRAKPPCGYPPGMSSCHTSWQRSGPYLYRPEPPPRGQREPPPTKDIQTTPTRSTIWETDSSGPWAGSERAPTPLPVEVIESFYALLQKNVLNRCRWATRGELRLTTSSRAHE